MKTKINYKKTSITEQDGSYEIEDLENIYLKSTYNSCNAATCPHFAYFKREKCYVAITIEKYHSINVSIEYGLENFEPSELYVKKFIEKQKGDIQPITREEFFEYYNKLTKFEK